MNINSKRAVIFGYGYTGFSIDNKLSGAGYTVTGVRRSWSGSDSVSVTSNCVEADITKPETLNRIDGNFDLLINCVSAGSRGNAEKYHSVYLEGSKNLLDWAKNREVSQVIYTGSTSVYGDHGGEWVTENSERATTSDSGKILKRTEDLYRDFNSNHDISTNILRLTGIYGPGRIRSLDRMKRGEVTIKQGGERYMNMIRREDIATALVTVATSNTKHMVYNVTDCQPIQEHKFYEWLSHKTGYEMPEVTDQASRRPNKRVSNQRLVEECNVSFDYPTFREGYSPLL